MMCSIFLLQSGWLVICREESEARNQRFNVVHVSFAKKEAALRERADEAELMGEHLRQVHPDLSTYHVSIKSFLRLAWLSYSHTPPSG